MSPSLAKSFSLPRAACTVHSRMLPSRKNTCTRTMWRNFEPLAVMSTSCCTSTFSEQQRGDAVRQIEMGRGETLRHVLPAHVVHRHLRTVDDDLLDLVRRERPLGADGAYGIERGVVAAHAGIELERDAHGLPHAAEAGGQLVQLKAVLRARERRAEPAVLALEHIHDAGQALLGKERAIQTTL